MDWTPAAIQQLRELWDEGHTTEEIGRRMKTTKNAVVGKAHRLGLTSRPSPIRRFPDGQVRPVPPKVVKIGQSTLPSLSTPAIVIRPPVPKQIVAAPVPIEPVQKTEPVVRDVVAFPRVSRPCQWPFGEPRSKQFRFCGDASVVGRPYCHEHCGIAYVRAPRLRLVAAE